MKLPENVWYVKERESRNVQIYLYVDIPNNSGIYEALRKVVDMCSVSDIEVVYILKKLLESYERIKYQLLYSLYDTREVSTKLCKQIVNVITQNIISIVIYIFILRYCNYLIIFL